MVILQALALRQQTTDGRHVPGVKQHNREIVAAKKNYPFAKNLRPLPERKFCYFPYLLTRLLERRSYTYVIWLYIPQKYLLFISILSNVQFTYQLMSSYQSGLKSV